MPHVTADIMTKGPVMRLHAGLNIAIAEASVTTNDGSLTVALMPLPAGARVVDTKIQQAGAVSLGPVRLYSTINGTQVADFMSAVAVSGKLYVGNGNGFGYRHTASANLTAKFVAVGISAETVRAIISYDTVKQGD